MKISTLSKIAAMLALASASIAQNYALAVDDSTGNVPLRGNPQLNCASPFLADICSRLTLAVEAGGSGATLLPYDMPAGNYYNNADFPLQVAVSGVSGFSWVAIYVDGRLVGGSSIADSGARVQVTGLVPSKSSFSVVGGTGVATAIRNNATWQQTGIRFAVSDSVWFASLSPAPAPVYRSVAKCYSFDSYGELGVYAVDAPSCASNGTELGYFDSFGRFIYISPRPWSHYSNAGQVGTQVVNTKNPNATCSGGTRSLDNWGEYSSSFIITYSFSVTSSSQCTAAALQASYEQSIYVPPPPPIDTGTGR